MTGFVFNSGGAKNDLPALTNPASTSDILSGKEVINSLGQKMVGEIISKGPTTYAPSPTERIISAGQYLSGDQVLSPVVLQSKTASPSSQQQTISPDPGKYLSSVIITASQAKYSYKTISPTDAKTLTVNNLTFSPVVVAFLLASPWDSMDDPDRVGAGFVMRNGMNGNGFSSARFLSLESTEESSSIYSGQTRPITPSLTSVSWGTDSFSLVAASNYFKTTWSYNIILVGV